MSITLVILLCTDVSLTNCKLEKRVQMPPKTTMFSCERVRDVMLYDETGKLIIDGEYKKIICEQA